MPSTQQIRASLKKIRTQGILVGVLGLIVAGLGFCNAYEADQALGTLDAMELE